MARTKQTARKSTGGKAPRQQLACKSPSQYRQFMTSQQAATYQTSSSTPATKTSYLNYENVFGSFGFPMGDLVKETFKPQFDAGYSVNPIDKSNEPWLCMKLKSKFDGAGIDKHQRPELNIVMVIDISGSMASLMSSESTAADSESKLDAAKKCMLAICDKFTNTDFVGLIAFDDRALRIIELSKWDNIMKTDLQDKIKALRPTGMTNLSLAYTEATKMLKKGGEKQNSFSRIIFMTDLNSTVDSVRDEKDLLAKIETNSKNNIYTTVVGIGMDFNVTLVEKISSIQGANYISVSSGTEFVEVVGKEFNYNVTITAFQIKVDLPKGQNSFEFLKGYGSPEISKFKKNDQFCLSSEFASAQNENGEINGGVLLFKLKTLKKDGKKLTIKLCFQDIYTSAVTTLNYTVALMDPITDIALRKAILLTHFVDLHNDYVMEKKGVKHLERFQSFKKHFTEEMEAMNDDSITSNNTAYMEMTDKVIELELEAQKNPKPSTPPPTTSGNAFTILSNTSNTPTSSKKNTAKKPLKRLVKTKGKQTKKPTTVKTAKLQKPVAMPKIKSEPLDKKPKIKLEPVDTKPKIAGVRTSARKRPAANIPVVSPAKKVKVEPKPKKAKSPKKKLTKPTAVKTSVRKVTTARMQVTKPRAVNKRTRTTKRK